jgi:DNA-binding beta-propeller fold protein YncE
MKKVMVAFSALSSVFLGLQSFGEARPPLQSEKPIIIVGKAGRFDLMAADLVNHRILGAHKGAGTLVALDLKTNSQPQSIPVGEAQGVAVSAKTHQYFIGNEGDQKVVVVDSKTLQKTAEIKVDGPIDAIAYDDKREMLYAGEDDGEKLWVIDTKKNAVVTTIALPGVPEVIEYDSVTDRLYQNIKTKDAVVRINPVTHKIDATWSTLPVLKPHGLVIDRKRSRIYVAGSNGKLAAIDLKSGKVLASTDIAPGVDQIAYDSDLQLIYCACKGYISVTKASDAGLATLGKVASHQGAHTLAVDATSHDVWVSFADQDHSYFQKFKVSK